MPKGIPNNKELKQEEVNVDTPVVTSTGTETTANAEFVQVKKASLDDIIKRLERAEYALDKARTEKYDKEHQEKGSKEIKLRTFEGKIVTGWSDMITNTVERNPLNGAWVEDQKVKVSLDGEGEKEVSYVMFIRRYSHVKAEVIEEIKGKSGVSFKVKTEDGKEFTINEKFIN